MYKYCLTKLVNFNRLEKDRQTARSEVDDMKATVDHISKEKVIAADWPHLNDRYESWIRQGIWVRE